MEPIYFDYNASTPVRPEVVQEMVQVLAGPPGNPSSLHHFGQDASRERETARRRVAEAVGCPPGWVVFTSGGTEADNLALRGVVKASGKRHVVTAATEHEAILQTLEDLEEEGVETTLLPVDEDGRIDPLELDASIRRETALVSLMAANNETGVLISLSQMGEICRRRSVLFHTDAVQLFGKSFFDFQSLPLDLASISSHKVGGPKGVGALLVRPGTPLRAKQTGGGQERAIRPGTENLPGIVGFGKAAEIAAAELRDEATRLGDLRDRFEEGLRREFPSARINGSGADRLPNTSNVSFVGLDGESLLIALDQEGVAVSTGAACRAGAAEPSHVLRAMGRTREEASASIRFSLGWRSRDSDIDDVLSVLPGVARRLANSGSTL